MFTIYAGKPGRIDDYYMLEGDLLFGGALQWESRPYSYQLQNIEIKSIAGRVELQHLQNGASESLLNWSLNGAGNIQLSELSDLKLDFGGSYQFEQQQHYQQKTQVL